MWQVYFSFPSLHEEIKFQVYKGFTQLNINKQQKQFIWLKHGQRDLNSQFSKEDNRYTKKVYSVSNHQKMQIRITKSCDFTPIRMTTIKRQEIINFGEERKRNTCTPCWECKSVRPLWKAVWKSPKKLKIELPCNPEIPLLVLYHKEMSSAPHSAICTPIFIAAFLTIAKIRKHPKCTLTDEWIIILYLSIYLDIDIV
jgi:hypothetical protein